MAIIKIHRWTAQLKIRVAQPYCGGSELPCHKAELFIQPVVCETPVEKVVTNSDCFTNIEYIPVPPPTLRYPCHEIDNDGKMVFYFDSKLQKFEPGRYIGTVSISGLDCVKFEIDLFPTEAIILDIETVDESVCGVNKC